MKLQHTTAALKYFIAFLFISIVFIKPSNTVADEQKTSQESGNKIYYGDPEADIKLNLFVSYSCPHCGYFFKEVYPKLEKEYIASGQVRLIVSFMPMDGISVHAAQLTQCVEKKKQIKFTRWLFRNQPKWRRSNNPIDELNKVSRLAGLSQDTIQACLLDKKGLVNLSAAMQTDNKNFDITHIPLLFINKKHLDKELSYENIKKALDKLL